MQHPGLEPEQRGLLISANMWNMHQRKKTRAVVQLHCTTDEMFRVQATKELRELRQQGFECLVEHRDIAHVMHNDVW
jgi:hypothetical protein